jgi:SAM-dependent methyltransferase
VNQLKGVLAMPWAYRLFARVIGARRARDTYIRQFVRAWPGARILDLGCGPADVLGALPDVEYVGVDISPDYIRAAKERYGSRGKFVCASAVDYVVAQTGSFDIVLANGVLHHLDDREADGLLHIAREALKPEGRFVSLDGCYVPNQSRVARWMLNNDRGRFVRRRDDYTQLAAAHFPTVEAHITHRLLNIPYTHIIMVCSVNEASPDRARGESDAGTRAP